MTDTTRATDSNLVDQVLSGNTDLFRALVERYLPMMRALCVAHVYDPSVQDDLVQDSFLDGFLKLKTLRNRARFGPWLASITRNKCKSWQRKERRQAKAYEALARQSDAAANPHAAISRKEVCQWVEREIATLPKKNA